eukprot:TRINITY_DN39907_c0_g1_i1.p1 TRINITY_DN39907_c0_g1~~TRINITY_DN39907_c0_g1_i1.p1  ORF type:complete len:414 (+),score=137.96 TRINITY_DN39907_c0_g1_i1:87-1244(+)
MVTAIPSASPQVVVRHVGARLPAATELFAPEVQGWPVQRWEPGCVMKGWPQNPHAPQPRPGEGDLVMLSGPEPERSWALRPGEVGVVRTDDGSVCPFLVEGPRGDVDWYTEAEVAAVVDRPLSVEMQIAAEQLFRQLHDAMPADAHRVIALMVDCLDHEGLCALVCNPDLLATHASAALAQCPRTAAAPLPKATPLAAGDLLGASLPAAIPLSPPSHVNGAPQPLDPTAVCGAHCSSPAAHMVSPITATPCLSATAHFASPSVAGSVDTHPTACQPPSCGGSSSTSTPHRAADYEPVGRAQLGELLYSRVVPLAPEGCAGKITGMLLDGVDDITSVLRTWLSPQGRSQLAIHVADAVAVLREAGKLPIPEAPLTPKAAVCSAAAP